MTATVDARELLATSTPFRAWLEQQPAHAFVGHGGNTEDCPVANYLKDAGYCYASVGKWDVQYRVSLGDYQQIRSEQWLCNVVAGIDGLCGSAPVTVAEARAVLASVEHEAKYPVLVRVTA